MAKMNYIDIINYQFKFITAWKKLAMLRELNLLLEEVLSFWGNDVLLMIIRTVNDQHYFHLYS